MAAHPVQVVKVSKDHIYELNEDAFGEILLKDDIRDRTVIIISVAGAFRKGKSFLLGFFIRYMYATVSVLIMQCLFE
jgi:atlastin